MRRTRTGRAAEKQSLTPGGMFYTAQSGIWQSVWMEWVPETYLERIVITPEYDTASVKVRVFLNGPDAGLTEKNYGAGERSAGCEGDLRPGDERKRGGADSR